MAKDGDKEIMKSEGGERKRKGKKWWIRGLQWLRPIGRQLVTTIVMLGIVLYVVGEYGGSFHQPFELATVAGLLGGFPLVAAFGEKVRDERMRSRLKMMAGLYLLAAISFVVFGFFQTALLEGLLPDSGAGKWICVVIYAVALWGGAAALAIGMGESLEILPWLLRPFGNWLRDGARMVLGKRDK